MKETMNWIGVVMAAAFVFLMWTNAGKVGSTVKSGAVSLVYVQKATAQHTADANQVIEWASKR